MHSRLSKKQGGSHGMNLDVDVAMDSAGRFSGADNTTLKLTLGSNFCVRPQNCIFEDCVCADSTMLSDNRAAAQFCRRIDNCCFGYSLRPLGRFHVPWFPAFLQNNTMNFQIFRARTDVEPVAVIKNYTANPSALTDPLNKYWNERDFLAGRDPW